MDKSRFYLDELKQTRPKEVIKLEKDIKKQDLPINPKFVFDKKPKNIPKKQYRPPKSLEHNSPKNPFKMSVKSKY